MIVDDKATGVVTGGGPGAVQKPTTWYKVTLDGTSDYVSKQKSSLVLKTDRPARHGAFVIPSPRPPLTSSPTLAATLVAAAAAAVAVGLPHPSSAISNPPSKKQPAPFNVHDRVIVDGKGTGVVTVGLKHGGWYKVCYEWRCGMSSSRRA